jgi:TolA-binding protein
MAMTELDSLAKALKKELGAPPEVWQRTQRERLRESLARNPQRPGVLRFAPVLAAALVAVCALVWVTWRGPIGDQGEPRAGVEAFAGPIRLEDGSGISLAPGGRGRLMSDARAVRFELQSGRADFDVVPSQKRTWTITAGKNVVTVIGTRFSVTYDPSGAFDVQVERGMVSVQVPERRASVELKAGDHLRGRSGQMEVSHTSPGEPARAAAESPRTEAPEPAVSASPAPPAEPTPVPSADWRGRYRDGKYAEALTLLRASRVTERLEELGPRALAEVADVARLGGDTKLAARALTLLIRQYPRAGEARDAQFLLGRVHALSGDRASAIRAFESYLEPGGSTQYANEATGRLMELYAGRGDEERARTMARRYLTHAPNGPYRRLALSLTK